MTKADINHKEAVQFAKDFLSKPVLLNDLQEIGQRIERDPKQAARMDAAIEDAARNPDTNDFDMLVGLAASLLREDERLPEFLAVFIADVLEGKRKRPTKRGSDKYTNWIRNYELYRAVKEVASKYKLPHYTNNELSEKPTAAGIVAKASGYGADVIVKAFTKFQNSDSCMGAE
ncbi:MAG: hypothetical protein R3E36_13290 [Nitrosomonas sp.]|nr:hypothetical protein [Nitrosomonas sp.]